MSNLTVVIPTKAATPAPATYGAGEAFLSAVPAVRYSRDSRPIDPSLWRDEQKMKEELVAWAKAVASMAASASRYRSSPHRRR